jgi:MFS transporter, DHA1 family, tetracycline resistance protein
VNGTVRPRLALAIVVATVLVDMIGFGIVMPVLPQLIMDLTGKGLAHAARIAGWLAFAFAVVQFVFAPIMGSLSDRFGRRPVLIAALAAFAVNYMLTAFAPTVLWLFAGRMMAGATGASFSTAYAYVTDISTDERRTQNFGLLGMAMGVGFVIGPALGGFAGELGTRAPFMLAAAIASLNALVAWFFLPESLGQDRRQPFHLRRANPISALARLAGNPLLRRLAIGILLVQTTFMILNTIWPFYTIARFAWSSAAIGVSLTFSGLISAGVRGGLIRIVIPRWGELKVAMGAIAAQIVGQMVLAFGTAGWMMFVGIGIHSLAGLAYPALSSMASRLVPSENQGELQGAIASLTGLAAIAGPIIASQTFSIFANEQATFHFPAAPITLAACLACVALGLLLNYGKTAAAPRKSGNAG